MGWWIGYVVAVPGGFCWLLWSDQTIRPNDGWETPCPNTTLAFAQSVSFLEFLPFAVDLGLFPFNFFVGGMEKQLDHLEIVVLRPT